MLTYTLPAMWTYCAAGGRAVCDDDGVWPAGGRQRTHRLPRCWARARSIATPAFVLGGVVMAFSFIFLFFIVPNFSLRVERVIYSNIAQLVQSKIQQNHRIEMDQPGGRPLTIFAQQATVLPAPNDRPRDQVVRLVAPVFVTYEGADATTSSAPCLRPISTWHATPPRTSHRMTRPAICISRRSSKAA